MPARRCIIILAALLAAAAHTLTAQAAAQGAGPFKTDNSHTGSAAGGSTVASQFARECIAKAEQLGHEKVVGDSMACFLPFNGKHMQLSSADCCDKAELLFGKGGSMAHCMCCPDFVKELLAAIPLEKLQVTRLAYLEKLNLCRVPLVTTPLCSPSAAKERAPLPVGSNGPAFSMPTTNRPMIQQLNITGLYPYFMGLPTKYTATRLAAQGRSAVASGQTAPVKVVGASDFYNDYMAGYHLLIANQQPVPVADTRSAGKLPDLPVQHKDDVAWVAGLRRGPVPNLVHGRPEQYSPANTDPLQNGEVANMSPGVVFAGRVPAMNQP